MRSTDTIVIGGGQAGLATSRRLVDAGIDHAVLERGRLAERWRSERWDSLRLLTPRWQSRLPGYRYEGPEPDGYMSASELIAYLEGYAGSFDAPLLTETTVRSVRRAGDGYRVDTDRGPFRAAAVVVATGHCDRPLVPPFASRLSPTVHQVVPSRYRRPSDLPEGGVLVVGASATGVQLAEELHRSGRPVSLAVGRHTRLPRRYRGRDIMWWLDRMGVLDETPDDVADVEASRAQPSLQLVGRPDQRDLDLAALSRIGVRLLGRVLDAEGHRIRLSPDLRDQVAAADRKLARLLDRVDTFAERAGVQPVEGSWRPAPLRVPRAPEGIDLRAEGIRSVLWATGYRRAYPWLEVPVLDRAGDICQRGGVTPSGGLYTVGLRFQGRRKSSFIDGAGDDAADVTRHLVRHLARRRAA